VFLLHRYLNLIIIDRKSAKALSKLYSIVNSKKLEINQPPSIEFVKTETLNECISRLINSEFSDHLDSSDILNNP